MADNEIEPSMDGGREELVAKTAHIHQNPPRAHSGAGGRLRRHQAPTRTSPPARHSARLTSLDVPHRHQHSERAHATPADR